MLSNEPSIAALANTAWQNNVPALDPTNEAEDENSVEDNLKRLTDITLIVKKALENPQNAEAVAKVAHKCWEYATHLPDPRFSLLACQICYANLPEKAEGLEDQINRKAFKLTVGGEEIQLPGFYKTLLAENSPYFKALFEDDFKEKKSEVIEIENIKPAVFKRLLTFFEGNNMEVDNQSLEELIELLQFADRLVLNSVTQDLLKTLAETINSLEQTPEHRQILQEIFLFLKSTSYYGDLQVQAAIDNYFRKVTENLKTFEEYLAYAELHGNDLLSIDLSGYSSDFDDSQLEQILAKCPNLSSLKIQSRKMTDQALTTIFKRKNLTSLSLISCKELTDKGLEELQNLKLLTLLDLTGYKLTDEGLKNLKSLTRLQSLKLTACEHITDASLVNLKSLKHLSILDLYRCMLITDEGVKHLKELKELSNLNLSFCQLLTDKATESLQELKGLKILKLASWVLLTDEGFKNIAKLNGLSKLDLSYTQLLTKNALLRLSKLKNLESLNLAHCDNLKDDWLTPLNELTKLQRLELNYCTLLTDEALVLMQRAKKLEFLDIRNIHEITDEGLKNLRGLPNLTTLVLSNLVGVTNAGMDTLQNLSRLVSLNISANRWLTDEGLKKLASLPNLTYLRIADNPELTDESLKNLESFQALKLLDLSYCKKLTKEGIDNLQKLKPDLLIIPDYGYPPNFNGELLGLVI